MKLIRDGFELERFRRDTADAHGVQLNRVGRINTSFPTLLNIYPTAPNDMRGPLKVVECNKGQAKKLVYDKFNKGHKIFTIKNPFNISSNWELVRSTEELSTYTEAVLRNASTFHGIVQEIAKNQDFLSGNGISEFPCLVKTVLVMQDNLASHNYLKLVNVTMGEAKRLVYFKKSIKQGEIPPGPLEVIGDMATALHKSYLRIFRQHDGDLDRLNLRFGYAAPDGSGTIRIDISLGDFDHPMEVTDIRSILINQYLRGELSF